MKALKVQMLIALILTLIFTKLDQLQIIVGNTALEISQNKNISLQLSTAIAYIIIGYTTIQIAKHILSKLKDTLIGKILTPFYNISAESPLL